MKNFGLGKEKRIFYRTAVDVVRGRNAGISGFGFN